MSNQSSVDEPPTKDIEKGKNGTDIDSPSGDKSDAGEIICCCDTRIASITWFSISFILETVGLISIFTTSWVTWRLWAIIIDVVFLILTIIGLVGCAKVNKSMVSAGEIGYILKAVIIAIGTVAFIILFLVSFGTYFGGIHIGTLVVPVLYFIFMVVGAKIVGKLVKEIEAGIFIKH